MNSIGIACSAQIGDRKHLKWGSKESWRSLSAPRKAAFDLWQRLSNFIALWIIDWLEEHKEQICSLVALKKHEKHFCCMGPETFMKQSTTFLTNWELRREMYWRVMLSNVFHHLTCQQQDLGRCYEKNKVRVYACSTPFWRHSCLTLSHWVAFST